MNDHLDELILSKVHARWRKVAMVIVLVAQELETAGETLTLDEIGRRITAMVAAGRLQGAGDLSRWRHSEVRLPGEE